MTTKRVVLRERAKQDVNDAIDHYLNEGAEQAALHFVDDLERAYIHLSRQSASGSPRYAHELNLPGLRFWPLTRFAHLVFYFERGDVVDVWRVLHAKQDIPSWMQES
ncbi:MAG: type II toxin-antitoxin system RelE/ParE family toxin [Burkholderiales bacterium]